MNIPHTWKYVGFVCFPNLENKQILIDAGAVKDEELKVLMILVLDFTTHNDDTLRADEGQVQDDSKNNDITEEDDDCQYISVIAYSIHDFTL